MSETNTQYFYFASDNDEQYFCDPFNTRDEALAYGLKEYPETKFYIAKGYKLNWHNADTGNFVSNLWEYILESFGDNHYEGSFDELPEHLSDEDEAELEELILNFCERKFKNPFGYQMTEDETITFHLKEEN